MKKHVFALGMAAAMCFNLVGCSNETTQKYSCC